MAFCEVGRGVENPMFRRFLSPMEDSDFSIKPTPGRVSKAYPDFEEVRPFHDAYVERFPDQLVFGSDGRSLATTPRRLMWPHGRSVRQMDADETLRPEIW